MTKWEDKHMYNWIGWMEFIYATWNKINEWTVTPTSPFKFAIFVLNITLGSILMGLLTGLMLFPQTIEWIMKNLMDEVDKLGSNKDKGIKHNIKEFAYVMTALFVLIPYIITWGLPKLIMKKREEKRLRRVITMEQRRREMLRQETEDISRWDNYLVGDVEILWPYAPAKKDFTPKRELKAHTMVEPSRGNYSIAFGSNNVATGNYSISPWPSDVTIRIDRENNTSTAYIRTDNMT